MINVFSKVKYLDELQDKANDGKSPWVKSDVGLF